MTKKKVYTKAATHDQRLNKPVEKCLSKKEVNQVSILYGIVVSMRSHVLLVTMYKCLGDLVADLLICGP
mgnify:CR=1 FL=1